MDQLREPEANKDISASLKRDPHEDPADPELLNTTFNPKNPSGLREWLRDTELNLPNREDPLSNREVKLLLGQGDALSWDLARLLAYVKNMITAPRWTPEIADLKEKEIDCKGAFREYTSDTSSFGFRHLMVEALNPERHSAELFQEASRVATRGLLWSGWIPWAVGLGQEHFEDRERLQEGIWELLREPVRIHKANLLVRALLTYALRHGSKLFVVSRDHLASNSDPDNLLGTVLVTARPGRDRVSWKAMLDQEREYCQEILSPAMGGAFGENAFDVLRKRLLLGLYSQRTRWTGGFFAIDPTKVPFVDYGRSHGIGKEFLTGVLQHLFSHHPECGSLAAAATPEGRFDKLKVYKKWGAKVSLWSYSLGPALYRTISFPKRRFYKEEKGRDA